MVDSTVGKAGETIAGAFLLFACIVFRPLLRPWYSKWGATGAELTQGLPGDEYVPRSRGGYTQAIGIKASANSVWPLAIRACIQVEFDPPVEPENQTQWHLVSYW
jgi:hypothetical protein